MGSSHLHIGCYAPDFELPGVDGSVHHLRQYLNRFRGVGVVFLSYDCDPVLPALAKLAAIQAEFLPKHITLMGIDSNVSTEPPSDRLEAMAAFAKHHHLSFPYLRDETQDVAETFGATHVPQVFLVNQHGMISYSGSIWGVADDQTERAFLREAIAALLDGSPPPITTTPVQGCRLQWRIR